MAFNRFTQQRIYPQFQAESLQEKMAIPLMKRQREEQLLKSAGDMMFQLPATQQDMESGVNEDLQSFRKRRDAVTEKVMQGNLGPDTVAELYKINRDWNAYQNDTSRRGFQAKQFYTNARNWENQYVDQAVKAGQSPERAVQMMQQEKAKLQQEGRWGAIAGEGNFRDFSSVAKYAPKFHDYKKDIQTTLNNVRGFREGNWGKDDFTIDTSSGMPVFKITEKGKYKTNAAQIEQAANALLAEYSNPNSDKARAMEWQGIDRQEAIDAIGYFAGASTYKSTVDGKTRYMNLPASAYGGKGGDRLGFYKPDGFHSNIKPGKTTQPLAWDNETASMLPGKASPDGRWAGGIGAPGKPVLSTKATENNNRIRKAAEAAGMAPDEYIEAYNKAIQNPESVANYVMGFSNTASEYFKDRLDNRITSLTFVGQDGKKNEIGQLLEEQFDIDAEDALEAGSDDYNKRKALLADAKYVGISPTQGSHVYEIGGKQFTIEDDNLTKSYKLSMGINEAISAPWEGSKSIGIGPRSKNEAGEMTQAGQIKVHMDLQSNGTFKTSNRGKQRC